MINTIIQLLPILLLVCAILTILINMRAFFAYCLYIITMISKPHKLIKTAILLEKKIKYEKKGNTKILLPLIRLKTITKVLLFPDIDIARIVHKNKT